MSTMSQKSQQISLFLLIYFLLIPASQAGAPTLGRCHMDSCSWSKTLSKKEIASDERGKLILLQLLGGSSPNDDNQNKPKITWNKSSHEVYIFCSTRLPAVMMESGGELQVDVLDFWEGIPDIYESSANLYRETCHPGSESISDEDLAKRYRYSPSPDSDISITKPTEIFGYIPTEIVRNNNGELPNCDDPRLHKMAAEAIINAYSVFGLPATHESVRHLTNATAAMETPPPDLADMSRRQMLSNLSRIVPGLKITDLSVCRAEYLDNTSYMQVTAIRNPDNRSEIGVIVQNIATPAGSPGLYGWVLNYQ
jgi:hypothetical protein